MIFTHMEKEKKKDKNEDLKLWTMFFFKQLIKTFKCA